MKRIHGKPFYYRFVGSPLESAVDGGALASIEHDGKRMFAHFDSHVELLEFALGLPDEARCMYEVVRGAQKLKFDLDYAAEPGNPNKQQHHDELQRIIAAVKQAFAHTYHIELDNVIIADSSGADKSSFHIIVPGYHVANHHESKAFFDRLPHFDALDAAVYGSLQQFRMVHCHKQGSSRVKTLCNGTPLDSLITYLDGSIALPSIIPVAPPTPSTARTKPLNDELAQLVQSLSADRAEHYHTWIRVGMAIKHSHPDNDGGLALWKAFSAQSSKYTAAECERRWLTFAANHHAPLTVRSLVHWSKEDAYAQLFTYDELSQLFLHVKQHYIVDLQPSDLILTPSVVVVPQFDAPSDFHFPIVDNYELANVIPTWQFESRTITCSTKRTHANTTPLVRIPPVPQMYQSSGPCFDDCVSKFSTGTHQRAEVETFVRATLVYILNGGSEPYYLAKNRRNGNVEYTRLANLSAARFKVKLASGDPVRLSGIIVAMHSQILHKYETFTPSPHPHVHSRANDTFNVFTGYIAQIDYTLDVDMALLQPFLSHIRTIWCSDNDEHYEYILCWLASIVQRPTEKLTALVLKSKQGAGKGTIAEFLISALFGKAYAQSLSNIDNVCGQFNGLLHNKLFTVCDEIGNFGGAYKSNDLLKSLITNTEQEIRRMRTDPMVVPDYNHFWFFTNNDWAVKVEASDRRYFALELNNSRCGDSAYFDTLRGSLTDACAAHLINWLARIDLRRWKKERIPQSKFKSELKLNSVSLPVRFIIALVNGEVSTTWDGGIIALPTASLYEKYSLWCDNQGEPHGKFSLTAFSKELGKLNVKRRQFRSGKRVLRGHTLDRTALMVELRHFLKDDNMQFNEAPVAEPTPPPLPLTTDTAEQ